MPSERIQFDLPYSTEQLFDLAADVERYPEFLPGWVAARVRQREANRYCTDQVLGLGPLRVRFATQTVLQRPERIDVTSDEAPFRRFRLSWLFQPQGHADCRVTLSTELEFRSRVLERIADRALPVLIGDIVAAFDIRARELYATQPAPGIPPR